MTASRNTAGRAAHRRAASEIAEAAWRSLCPRASPRGLARARFPRCGQRRNVVCDAATTRGVDLQGVLAVAPDKPFKEKLLPVSVAFDATGKPTAAAAGQAEGQDICSRHPRPRDGSDICYVEHDGKNRMSWSTHDVAKGGPLVSALQSALEDAHRQAADRQGHELRQRRRRTTTTRNSCVRHTAWSRCTATTSSTCVRSG